MANKESTEKKFKSRIRKIKKVNKSEEEKEKFFSQIGVSLEVFLPTKDPELENDGIILYTNNYGKIVDAEYYFQEEDSDPFQIPIEKKDLNVIIEMFDDFKLELDEVEL